MARLSGELGDYKEAWLTAQVKALLDSLKPHLWYWKVSDRYTIGIPDIIGLYYGIFFAIELKKPGKKPRKIQSFMLARIKKAGGKVLVAQTLEEVQEFIAEIPPVKSK